MDNNTENNSNNKNNISLLDKVLKLIKINVLSLFLIPLTIANMLLGIVCFVVSVIFSSAFVMSLLLWIMIVPVIDNDFLDSFIVGTSEVGNNLLQLFVFAVILIVMYGIIKVVFDFILGGIARSITRYFSLIYTFLSTSFMVELFEIIKADIEFCSGGKFKFNKKNNGFINTFLVVIYSPIYMLINLIIYLGLKLVLLFKGGDRVWAVIFTMLFAVIKIWVNSNEFGVSFLDYIGSMYMTYKIYNIGLLFVMYFFLRICVLYLFDVVYLLFFELYCYYDLSDDLNFYEDNKEQDTYESFNNFYNDVNEKNYTSFNENSKKSEKKNEINKKHLNEVLTKIKEHSNILKNDMPEWKRITVLTNDLLLKGLIGRYSKAVQDISQYTEFLAGKRHKDGINITNHSECVALLKEMEFMISQIKKHCSDLSDYVYKLEIVQMLFKHCTDKSSVKKAYIQGSKIYHPDNKQSGSDEMFKILNAEYEKQKAAYNQ